MDDPGFDPRLLLDMLARQWRLSCAIACVLLVLAAAVAYLWPATFRSTATILVEAQQIPQDFVRSTITTFADQRIQIISQTALARANLLELIERYRLYPLRRGFETGDELVLRMRSAINVVPVTANGRGEAVTIAFRVSFDYDDPEQAQRIASEITTLYLNANVKQRQESTAETQTFVSEESARLRTQVEQIEQRLEAFKTRNAGRLPEHAVSSVQLIEQARSDLERLARDLAGLEDRRLFLEAQLELLRTMPAATQATGAGTGVVANDPAERLRSLRLQLASATSAYSSAHPDVLRLRREIESLEAVVSSATPADPREAGALLAEAKERLSAAAARYTPDHPEVVQLQRRVASLEAAVGERVPGARAGVPAGARSAPASPEARFPSPVTMNLEAQLEALRTTIRGAEKERSDLRQRMREHEERLAAAPAVEREYAALTRDLESARAKYRELSGKAIEAEVALQLEKGRKAERFTLIEPPLQPEAPIKPNRGIILAIGGFLAIAIGIGCGLLRDLLDPSIRSARELQQLTALPLLAAVPARPSLREARLRVVRRRLVLASSIAAFAVVAMAIHLKVLPLQVAMAIAARRIDALPALLF